jgi:hypothetical protein
MEFAKRRDDLIHGELEVSGSGDLDLGGLAGQAESNENKTR